MTHDNPKPVRLPRPEQSFIELQSLLIAPIKTSLLFAALKLSVFDLLSEPRSAEAVAEILKTHPANTRVLLDGLAAFDLALKRDGLYLNSAIASAFLVGDSPTFLGDYLAGQWRYIEPVLEDLMTLIVDGPPEEGAEYPEDEQKSGSKSESKSKFKSRLNSRLNSKSSSTSSSQDDLARWAEAVAEYERAGIAQTVAELIGGLPEFPSLQKMLDLGGGPGLIGMAVVASHPTMRGVIFDLPPVAKVAEKFVRDFGMEDRMEVVAGDFATDPLGQEYDLILASASLYSSKHDLDSLIEKVYAALNPGGIFASLHEGLTSEKTKPEIMKLGWLPAELLGGDLAFERGEIRASMERAGFLSVSSRTLDTSVGPMDLDVGRKLRRNIYPRSDGTWRL
ncbi:MAG TPA: methyltransferase [Methanothrix sp.]|nr:methyltransferase [Methanothrix sp.]